MAQNNDKVFILSIYALKPKFQALLRPITQKLFRWGMTANQITLIACALSVLLGLSLFFIARPSAWFALIPLWMFVRMALNAIDGMLAREFGQKSRLGAYLNEVTDVVSDAALYLPFVWVNSHSTLPIAGMIWLAALSELVGILGQVVGKTRRYDGPMGKSDRAFVFGALGLWIAIDGSTTYLHWLFWFINVLLLWTIARRIRAGLQEA